jgi:phage I-like protein
MADENKAPDDKSEKATEITAPVTESTGKAEEKTQAPSNLPEKFKGKSPEEIADMYLQLEKKFGEHSKEVNDARQYLQERAVINELLAEDKELYSMFETRLKKKYTPKDESDGEVKSDPRINDLRKSEENRIIGDFQRTLGIDQMPAEKRIEVMKKVSSELAEMVDPGGNKPIGQIISETSLSKLPKLLENAYFLAYKDSLIDKGKLEPDLASIGSIATASSGKSDPINTLTERERDIAKKLGVSEDKYLERKKQINK